MKRISQKRIVPAVTVDNTDEALPLAEALLKAGLDIIEITFRTNAAEESIRLITRHFPKMLVGAGTVLTADQLDRAIDAGVRFAVAPGFNEQLVTRGTEAGIQFMPGIMTPTEVDRAVGMGCRLLKFFPAEAIGGTATLKALAAPFAHTGVKFLPTGGINASNAAAYLELPVVAAVGGSWMVAREFVRKREWKEITRLTQAALSAAGKFPPGG